MEVFTEEEPSRKVKDEQLAILGEHTHHALPTEKGQDAEEMVQEEVVQMEESVEDGGGKGQHPLDDEDDESRMEEEEDSSEGEREGEYEEGEYEEEGDDDSRSNAEKLGGKEVALAGGGGGGASASAAAAASSSSTASLPPQNRTMHDASHDAASSPGGGSSRGKGKAVVKKERPLSAAAALAAANPNDPSLQPRVSKYKGVCWVRQRHKWEVHIYLHGKKRHVGYYDDEVLAAKAYDRAVTETCGVKAITNFDPITGEFNPHAKGNKQAHGSGGGSSRLRPKPHQLGPKPSTSFSSISSSSSSVVGAPTTLSGAADAVALKSYVGGCGGASASGSIATGTQAGGIPLPAISPGTATLAGLPTSLLASNSGLVNQGIELASGGQPLPLPPPVPSFSAQSQALLQGAGIARPATSSPVPPDLSHLSNEVPEGMDAAEYANLIRAGLQPDTIRSLQKFRMPSDGESPTKGERGSPSSVSATVTHITGEGNAGKSAGSSPDLEPSNKYKGVYWDPAVSKWLARISGHDTEDPSKLEDLGHFSNEWNAHRAYRSAHYRYFGDDDVEEGGGESMSGAGDESSSVGGGGGNVRSSKRVRRERQLPEGMVDLSSIDEMEEPPPSHHHAHLASTTPTSRISTAVLPSSSVGVTESFGITISTTTTTSVGPSSGGAASVPPPLPPSFGAAGRPYSSTSVSSSPTGGIAHGLRNMSILPPALPSPIRPFGSGSGGQEYLAMQTKSTSLGLSTSSTSSMSSSQIAQVPLIQVPSTSFPPGWFPRDAPEWCYVPFRIRRDDFSMSSSVHAPSSPAAVTPMTSLCTSKSLSVGPEDDVSAYLLQLASLLMSRSRAESKDKEGQEKVILYNKALFAVAKGGPAVRLLVGGATSGKFTKWDLESCDEDREALLEILLSATEAGALD